MSGRLIGVGVGPGDPELLTIKAIRLIGQAEVLAYPVDETGSSRARRTAAGYIREGQKELPLIFCMSPQRAQRLEARRKAAGQVLALLNEGLDVVFITEGDPLLYSTFQHLLSAIPEDVKVEICPGVSAMTAAAAAGRFPLAIEGQGLFIQPAKKALGKIGDRLNRGQALVLYKAAAYLKDISDEIRREQIPCEALLVENATLDGEVVLKGIETWMDRRASYFSMVLIRRQTLRETET